MNLFEAIGLVILIGAILTFLCMCRLMLKGSG